MTAEHDLLVERVRAALAGRDVREVRMFGGLAFMVGGALAVSVGGDGGLLVRIDPARRDELLARPGARPAAMKYGRLMGEGWVQVGPEGLATDADLRSWLDVGESARPA
ncbi:hypothetical protein AFL01nite_29220 [Aeromicrobium flavum]|uniref:TfoX N-terminal domain-containing protein n=1 Tax=Aeromicrobium flavum TaxID=416568 RepID=A0A512HYR7_9ACTN|nr:TfoX/Sxy family protein [Aeromicrobium flavum]GEO90595.1 hypothetical protein AFL01nite_29220 [Aeromicrobium flavum]